MVGIDEYSDDELSPRERQQHRYLWETVMVGSDSLIAKIQRQTESMERQTQVIQRLIGVLVALAVTIVATLIQQATQ